MRLCVYTFVREYAVIALVQAVTNFFNFHRFNSGGSGDGGGDDGGGSGGGGSGAGRTNPLIEMRECI